MAEALLTLIWAEALLLPYLSLLAVSVHHVPDGFDDNLC